MSIGDKDLDKNVRKITLALNSLEKMIESCGNPSSLAFDKDFNNYDYKYSDSVTYLNSIGYDTRVYEYRYNIIVSKLEEANSDYINKNKERIKLENISGIGSEKELKHLKLRKVRNTQKHIYYEGVDTPGIRVVSTKYLD